MRKVGTKKNMKGLFGFLATFAMALGIGVSLAPRDVKGVKAADVSITLDVAALGGVTVLKTGNYDGGAERLATVEGVEFGSKAITVNNNTKLQGQANNAVLYNISTLGKIKSVTINSLDTARATTLYGGTSRLVDDIATNYEPEGTSEGAKTGTGTWDLSSKNYTYFAVKRTSGSASYWASVVVTFEQASNSVVSALGVDATSKSYTTSDILQEADFAVSVTKDGSAGTSADYTAKIGTGTGSGFVGSDIVWGTTKPKVADTTIQFKAKHPQTSGGSDYLIAEVVLTVTPPVFGTLSSIAIKTPAAKNIFIVGDAFSADGLVLTASDESSPVVTKDIATGYVTDYDGITFDASHVGEKEVTVSYTEGVKKTITYNITVFTVLPGFKQVSASEALSVGATYTIATAAGETRNVISKLNSGGKFYDYITVPVSSDKFDYTPNVMKLQLENGSAVGSYAFKILNTADAGKYITYSGSSNDLYATALESITAAGSWTYTANGIENVGITGRFIRYNNTSPRFSAYTSAQTAVSLYVDEATIIPEPEFVSTTRIELATDFVKKIFHNHETYTSEGLKVVAYDDVNGVSKIVETGFTTDFDGKVFASADVANGVVVKVTYDGFNETYLIDVKEARSFVKVTNKFQLQVGGYYIATGIDTDNGLVALGKQEGTNRNVVSIVENEGTLYENDAVQVLKLHKGHADVKDSFAFESLGGPKDGQFLAATGTGTQNYMTSQATVTVKGSWVINVGESTTIEATGAGYSRNKMRYNDTSDLFSAYEGGQNDITLYVDESTIIDLVYFEAKAFADKFDYYNNGDGQGITDPETCEDNFLEMWLLWDELSLEAKALFKEHEDFAVERQRLLNWAHANGLASLDEMDGGSDGIRRTEAKKDTSLLLTATVLIGVIGLTTLLGYFLLKKRETNK